MLTNPRKLLTIQRLLSIIRPYKPLYFIFPSLDGRGKGRVDGYGVITVSKDSSGRITVSFHYDPQLSPAGDCPRFTDGAERSRRIGTVPSV